MAEEQLLEELDERIGDVRKGHDGLLYMLTAGVFGMGILWDLWTLNEQISVANRR